MRKRLVVFLIGAVMALAAVVVWAAYSLNPYTPGGTAGTAVSGRYEGRYLTFVESALRHPSHTDGLVDVGDPVIVGGTGLVGVALQSATASTDYIAIDTEGIWNLSITNLVNTSMAVGDEIFIDYGADGAGTGTLKNSNQDAVRFGTLLYAIATSNTAVVRPVKVHQGDNTILLGRASGMIWKGMTTGTITVTGFVPANCTALASVNSTTEGLALPGFGSLLIKEEYGQVDVRITSTTSWCNLPIEVIAYWAN